MRTFLISYDLARPELARNRLVTEIMQIGEAWARPLASTWYVRTAERRRALEARLRPLLDTDDGLIIQEVEADASLLNTALRWFRQRRTDLTADAALTPASNVIAFPSAAELAASPAAAA
jgi:hypothetical protein